MDYINELEGNLIICFGSFAKYDWNDIWQRQQEIVTRLAEKNIVLYIERLGAKNRSLFEITHAASKRIRGRRTLNKSKVDNLFFYQPLILPFHKTGLLSQLNGFLLYFQVKKWIKKCHLYNKRVITWVYYPADYTIEFLKRFESKLLVYDCVQRFKFAKDFSLEVDWIDQQIARKANLVFADSVTIYNEKLDLNSNTYQIPQGVSEKFLKNAKSIKLEINPPLIGYIGSFHSAFDLELFEQLIKSRTEYSFVVIGPVEPQLEQHFTSSYKNIFFLGKKSHEELPSYISAFDVLLIPYYQNEHSRGVFPTKLYEYLASNKPVVSTYLPDLADFEDYIFLARRSDDFIDLLDKAVTTPEKIKYPREKLPTWNQRFDFMEKLCCEMLQKLQN